MRRTPYASESEGGKEDWRMREKKPVDQKLWIFVFISRHIYYYMYFLGIKFFAFVLRLRLSIWISLSLSLLLFVWHLTLLLQYMYEYILLAIFYRGNFSRNTEHPLLDVCYHCSLTMFVWDCHSYSYTLNLSLWIRTAMHSINCLLLEQKPKNIYECAFVVCNIKWRYWLVDHHGSAAFFSFIWKYINNAQARTIVEGKNIVFRSRTDKVKINWTPITQSVEQLRWVIKQ